MKEHNTSTKPFKRTKRAIIISVFAAILFVSCTQHKPRPDISEQRAKADSVTQAIDDTTQLQTLASSYRQQNDAVSEMMACKRLGKILRENNNYQEAIDCHQREYTLAKSLHDTIDMVQALNNIGTNFRRFGILDEAANYHYQALTLCNEYSDKEDKVAKKNKGSMSFRVGNVSFR